MLIVCSNATHINQISNIIGRCHTHFVHELGEFVAFVRCDGSDAFAVAVAALRGVTPYYAPKSKLSRNISQLNEAKSCSGNSSRENI
jgi:hypothetical protein